jgi:rsbT co-antagonist protein RsbR
MNKNLVHIGKHIVEKKHEIAKEISRLQNPNYTTDEPSPKEINNLDELRVELVANIGAGLFDDGAIAVEKVRKWGENFGSLSVQKGFPLFNVLKAVPFYREVISKVIEEEAGKLENPLRTAMGATRQLDKLIDITASEFILAYDRYHQQMLKVAKDEVMELSIPVVPIMKGIAVLPLIGTVDTQRAMLLIEVSLARSVELKVTNMIIDLSGVPVIDTMVAQQIFQSIKALNLIGVQAIISGIRPEIAQTVVALGIDFKGTHTFSSLRQALSFIGIERRNDMNKY